MRPLSESKFFCLESLCLHVKERVQRMLLARTREEAQELLLASSRYYFLCVRWPPCPASLDRSLRISAATQKESVSQPSCFHLCLMTKTIVMTGRPTSTTLAGQEPREDGVSRQSGTNCPVFEQAQLPCCHLLPSCFESQHTSS